MEAERVAEQQAEPQGDSLRAGGAPATGTLALMRVQQQIGNRAFQHWLQRPEGIAAARMAAPRSLQRREVRSDSAISGDQDWTTADRVAESFPRQIQGNHRTPATRWQRACLRNLRAMDSSQYRRIVERRDFYWWFYHHIASQGYTTRWPLAAAIVANGAHEIADMDEAHETADDALALANVQLQGMMREGNQVIFDNVLPKLKQLLDGGVLAGPQALDWDMRTLAEEQTLVQPMYGRMSAETRGQLDYIARQRGLAGWAAHWWHLPWHYSDVHVPSGVYNVSGDVPAFKGGNLQSISDRWRYGMGLGNTFVAGGTGFDPARHAMPGVSADYASGAEFRRVDTRAALHQLDAWLSPNRLSRVGTGSDIDAIIRSLSEPEKRELVADSSPDGWQYSIQFAQFGFITEAQVRAAMPSDPALAGSVSAFMARWRAERDRVQLRYPTPAYGGIGF